jgi:Glycosyl hydrolases family 2, TIM barrel domain
MDPADIIAVNEYFGWYYGKLDDVGPMLDKMHEKYPNKPIIVSEFGAEAVAGWNPETAKAGSKDYSYDYQVKFLSSHLGQIYSPERRSYVAGGTIWVYSDFPDPHRINGDHPDMAKYRNNKGLVTMDRTPKPAYGFVQQFFHKLGHEQEIQGGGR